MMNRNMSHDNMSGFKEIDRNTIVEESEVSSWVNKAVEVLKDVVHTAYTILSEVIVPFLYVGAILRLLYIIVLFNDLWEVVVATFSAFALYYVEYVYSKHSRR